MPKGRKRVRGVPQLHEELKKRVSIALTPTGIQGLDALAARQKISRSELVERIGRGLISVTETPSVQLGDRQPVRHSPRIYLVMDGDRILYIGQETELKTQSLGHRHFQELKYRDADIRIAWIDCSDVELLPMIENALRLSLKPELGRCASNAVQQISNYQQSAQKLPETLLQLAEQLVCIAKAIETGNKAGAKDKDK
jgi:hypothetical protein